MEPHGSSLSLHSLLGSGSFGSVYQAVLSYSTGGSCSVAVKVPRSACVREGELALNNLRKEWQILQHVKHPCIVATVEWFESIDPAEHGGCQRPAIAFELAQLSLLDMFGIADGGARGSAPTPVHPDLARAWARDIGTALAYVHERQVIHRDVKPANILLFMNPVSAMGAYGDESEASRHRVISRSARPEGRKAAPLLPQAGPTSDASTLAQTGYDDKGSVHNVVSSTRALGAHRRLQHIGCGRPEQPGHTMPLRVGPGHLGFRIGGV